MVRLGESLKELRTERGISVRAVAEACDLAPSYVAKIEGGDTFKTIGLATVVQLAKFYGIPLPILLRDAGFLEETSDELPDFPTYLRQKFRLSPAAIRDFDLAKEIIEKKYPPRAH